MRTRYLAAFLATLGLCGLSLASSGNESAAASATARGTLEAALDTISAEEIKADIFFLASDELGGRDTVSPGQRVAARFIRSRLERLGIEPGAPTGYFFEYPLVSPRLRESDTWLRLRAGEHAMRVPQFSGDQNTKLFIPMMPLDLIRES